MGTNYCKERSLKGASKKKINKTEDESLLVLTKQQEWTKMKDNAIWAPKQMALSD